jgi:hypothetical protein
MSRRTARLAAAGLWIVGVGALFKLSFDLGAAAVIMLGVGAASIVMATWIYAVTLSAPAEPPEEAGTLRVGNNTSSSQRLCRDKSV